MSGCKEKSSLNLHYPEHMDFSSRIAKNIYVFICTLVPSMVHIIREEEKLFVEWLSLRRCRIALIRKTRIQPEVLRLQSKPCNLTNYIPIAEMLSNVNRKASEVLVEQVL